MPMASPRVTDRQGGFAGGMNSVADDLMRQPGEFRYAVNCGMTTTGQLYARAGTKRVHASAIGSGSPIRGGIHWVDAALDVAISNGRVHTGVYSMGMTWTARGSAADLDATAFPCFAPFRDGSSNALYMADGGLLNKYVPTTVTTNIAGTPSVDQIAVYNLRLWGSLTTNSQPTIYWSGLGNGDTLGVTASGGGSAIVRTFSNQKITALVPLGASLLIFHESGISRLTGFGSGDLDIEAGTTGISPQIGTICPRSIVVVENHAYFQSTQGIFIATESGVTRISNKITGYYFFGTNNDNLGTATNNLGFFRRETNELFFQCAASTPAVIGCPATAGQFVGYNVNNQQWFGHWAFTWSGNGSNMGTAWPSYDANNNPITLMGSSTGFVLTFTTLPSSTVDNVLSDGTGGTAYATPTVACRRFFFGDASARKTVRAIRLTAQVGSRLTLSQSDTQASAAVTDATINFTGVTAFRQDELLTVRVGSGLNTFGLDISVGLANTTGSVIGNNAPAISDVEAVAYVYPSRFV